MAVEQEAAPSVSDKPLMRDAAVGEMAARFDYIFDTFRLIVASKKLAGPLASRVVQSSHYLKDIQFTATPVEEPAKGAVGQVLNGYRAAVAYIGADSWDGCSDCIEILKAARTADRDWDWANDVDRIANELKTIRPYCNREVAPLTITPSPANAEQVEDLRHKLRMIVSHAIGGHSQDIDASVNDICVCISQARNLVWEGGVEKGAKDTLAALQAQPKGGAKVDMEEAAELAADRWAGAHHDDLTPSQQQHWHIYRNGYLAALNGTKP